MIPLDNVPTVVAATDDVVDLLPGVLADVGRPQLASGGIEVEPPRVAEAVGEDFRTAASVGEGVVGRDGVCLLYTSDAADE